MRKALWSFHLPSVILKFLNRDRLIGFFLYPVGDGLAQWMIGDVDLFRCLMLSLVGGLIYSYEIPVYFEWIDRKPWGRVLRILAAMAYFNPLWIARHLFFIQISYEMEILTRLDVFGNVMMDCISIGTKSFIAGIPISIVGNYIIQIRLDLKLRFFASSVFNAIMVIYYALSQILFHS